MVLRHKAFEDLIKSLQQLDQNLTDAGIDYELFKSQLQTIGQSTSLDELRINLDGLESELEEIVLKHIVILKYLMLHFKLMELVRASRT